MIVKSAGSTTNSPITAANRWYRKSVFTLITLVAMLHLMISRRLCKVFRYVWCHARKLNRDSDVTWTIHHPAKRFVSVSIAMIMTGCSMPTNGQPTSASLTGFLNRQMSIEKAISDRRRMINRAISRASHNPKTWLPPQVHNCQLVIRQLMLTWMQLF